MAKEAKDAKTSKAPGEGKLLTPKTEVGDHQKANVKQAYRSFPSPTMPQDMKTPLLDKKDMPQKIPSQKMILLTGFLLWHRSFLSNSGVSV
jgi:hypothetical protein